VTDAPDLAALARTVASLRDQLADQRGQTSRLRRELDRVSRNADIAALIERFEALAAEVRESLDAAAPRGPAAPRWDNLDADARATELTVLTRWVDTILIPGYVTDGSYELADCWPRHEQALRELSTLAAQWHRIYAPPRADLPLALEWHDRWLPGAMRRLAEAMRECKIGHRILPLFACR
jgi:hypothetical protein